MVDLDDIKKKYVHFAQPFFQQKINVPSNFWPESVNVGVN